MTAKAGDAFIDFHGDFSSLNKEVNATVGKLTSRFGKLGRAAVAGLSVVGAGAVAAGRALYDIGEQFDDAIDTIRVGTGATGRDLDGLRRDFKAVVASVPTDFGSASVAIADLNTRLGLTGRPLQHLSKQMLELSRITDTSIQDNIPAVTRLFGDWSVRTDRQARTLDKLFRVSQATGITVGDLSRYMVQFGSPLRQLGFDFDRAAAMFSRFEKEGVNLQTAMPGLRFALRTFAQAGRDPAVALDRVIRRIRDARTVMQANRIAFRVFGARAGPDLASAIREGRFELDELVGQMRNGRDTILGAAEDTADLAEQWQIFKNKVLVGLEPIASKVFDTINAGLITLMDGRVTDRLKRLFSFDIGSLQGLVDDLRDIGRVLADVFRDIGLPILRRQLAGVKQTLSGAAQVIRGIVRVIAGVLTLRFGRAWDGVKDIFQGGAKAILGALRTTTAPVRELAARAGRAIANAFSDAWDEVRDFFRDGIRSAMGHLRSAVSTARNAAGRVGSAITLPYRTAWSTVRRLTTNGVRNVISAVRAAVSGVRSAATRVANALKNVLGDAWNWLRTRFIRGVRVVLGVVRDITSPMRSAARRVGSAISGPIGDTWDTIKSIFTRSVRAVLSTLRGAIRPAAKLSGLFAIPMIVAARAVRTALRWIVRAVQAVLDKLGTLKNKISDVVPDLPDITPWEGLTPWQRGGHVNRGKPYGDSVPAILERDEYVLNRRAVRAVGKDVLDQLNFGVAPRFGVKKFAVGGLVGPFKTRSDVLGSGPGFIPYMNYLNSMFGPLNVISGLRPGSITTSGNVSNHARGAAVDISTPGGEGATQSNPMPPALSARMTAAYNWIRRYFAPINLDLLWQTMVGGNHFNHIHSGIADAYSFNPARMAAFISRLPRGAMFGGIPRIRFRGRGPLKDIAEGGTEMARRAANAYISGALMEPGFGMSRATVDPHSGRRLGATTFGGPGDPGTGHIGYRGDDLRGKMAYAELDMGTALGNLPYRHPLTLARVGARRGVEALKLDIGLGGGPIAGLPRTIDLWYQTAKAMGLPEVWSGVIEAYGLQRGGSPDRRHRRRAGGRVSPLARNLRRTIRALGSPDAKRRSKSLRGLLRRIKGVGIPEYIVRRLRQLEQDSEVFGTRADMASQMNTLDELGNEVLGRVGGKDEAGWLHDQLATLFRWRNQLIRAKELVAKRIAHIAKLIEEAKRRLSRIAKEIRDAARERARLEKELADLQDNPRRQRKTLQDAIKDARDRLRRLRKNPKRNARQIEATKAAIRRYKERLDSINRGADGRRERRRTIRERLDTIAREQAARVRQREALKDRIIPGLRARREAMIEDRGNYLQNLGEVQGIGFPVSVMGSLPPLGGLGGQIFNVQLRLRDLTLSRPTVTDEAPEIAEGPEEATPEAAPEDPDTSERESILAQLVEQLSQRFAVSQAQYEVLSRYPFAGVFHRGGVVPGPPSQESIALVRGQEVISPDGLKVRFIVEDRRMYAQINDGEVREIVKDETRKIARSGQRPGSGRAGVLR